MMISGYQILEQLEKDNNWVEDFKKRETERANKKLNSTCQYCGMFVCSGFAVAYNVPCGVSNVCSSMCPIRFRNEGIPLAVNHHNFMYWSDDCPQYNNGMWIPPRLDVMRELLEIVPVYNGL